MNQTNHFFNLGYGWLCKHCCAEDAERKQSQPAAAAPGSGVNTGKEGCSPLALASWADSARHILTCPRCKVEEVIS